MEGDEERVKKAREEAAAARKQARQAWQQQRDAAVTAAILRYLSQTMRASVILTFLCTIPIQVLSCPIVPHY